MPTHPHLLANEAPFLFLRAHTNAAYHMSLYTSYVINTSVTYSCTVTPLSNMFVALLNDALFQIAEDFLMHVYSQVKPKLSLQKLNGGTVQNPTQIIVARCKIRRRQKRRSLCIELLLHCLHSFTHFIDLIHAILYYCIGLIFNNTAGKTFSFLW